MTEDIPTLIEGVVDACEADTTDTQSIQKLLNAQEPEEIALVLESLPVKQRVEAWRSVPFDLRLEALVAMRADPRERILDELGVEEVDTLLTGLDAEDLLELAESLSSRMIERALNRMDHQQREWYLSAQ